MSAVVGRVWGWVGPALSYRPWGSKPVKEEEQTKGRWGGMRTWLWPDKKQESDQKEFTKQCWEEREKVQPMEIEELRAGKLELEPKAQSAPRWWRYILPSTFLFWPRLTESKERKVLQYGEWNEGEWDPDQDAGESDYGTPPPSPTPLSQPLSPFRYFAHSWKVEVLPEHYDICFNFLRHLFDLFVVGFLWTVSPPVRVVLDVLGVQGALKLWIHGMAMFFVSTVGMAGLLWLIQEYLPQFALVYGVLQVLVISVSVHQSTVSGDGKEAESNEESKADGEGEPVQATEECNKKAAA
ncbi:uncharacterized protein C6orf47 homolog [Brienomyrus brachyistius]|uniref:uncharacterized protein C6orf47 homolog n=1 Tax=Brienomyrus brachyistius TaxID=42636 RepID=UPI0020B22872|nr:uncharacterized protein C6orf47 homolog [Brienomyrus brachyistius]XP_048848919.1 uncharacterized protein C6orf47 homolog [Brienomyrus brachyistius]